MNFIKTKICSWFSVISIILGSYASVYAEENIIRVDQIRVYFVGWDILTRSKLTPEDVRRMKHVYVEINANYVISNIIKEISKLNCKKFEEEDIGDIRLVLDVVNDLKVVDLLYANREYIYLPDKKVCKNNKEFLSAINTFRVNGR